VLRFVEKPRPDEVTTDTINAGIYVLETRILELMPAGVNTSIERVFFPAILARGDLVLGPVHRGYWIDIGTHEKYLQVHRDVLSRRFPVPLEGEPRALGTVHTAAQVSPEALLDGRFYVGPRCRVEAGARVGPDAVLVADVTVEKGARVRDSVLWAGAHAAADCEVEGSLVGAGVRLGRSSRLRGAVLGEGTVVSPFSRTL
jgi:NDP-sugar pyrophosphorylase family protein